MANEARLIEFLRAFQARKGMYMQAVTIDTVESFLTGFIVACHAFGVHIDYGGTRESLEKRGLESGGAFSPIMRMKSQGWSDERIIEESIEIVIETIEAIQANSRPIPPEIG
ncbi:hypothetical protein GC170_07620 [bacterium]|nr:hypothetical protein [bacterium]